LWLIVAICFQIGFGQSTKWGTHRKARMHQVGMINYIVAAVLTGSLALVTGGAWPGREQIALAIVNGIGLSTSFFLFAHLVEQMGVAIPAAVVRSAILAPIIYAAVIWQHWPDPYQWAGIGVFFVAVPMFGSSRIVQDHESPWLLGLFSFMLFCTQSVVTWSWTYFARIGRDVAAAQDITLAQLPVLSFVSMAMATAAVVLIVKQLISDGPRELVPGRLARLPGVCLGLANAGGISFMIPALREIPAAIAWPVASCCGVSATAILARVVWKEQLDKRAVIGLCLAVVVLVLVNLENMLAALNG